MGISALTPGTAPGTHRHPSRRHKELSFGCPTTISWESWSQRVENYVWSDGKRPGLRLAQCWRRIPEVWAAKPSQPGDLQGKQPAKATTEWEEPPAPLLSTSCNLGFHLLANFVWQARCSQQNGARRNPFWHSWGKNLVTPHFQMFSLHFSIPGLFVSHRVHGGASCTSRVSPGKKRCFQSRVSSSSNS